MVELNLEASNAEKLLIKGYLESNVSETLAAKINSGIRIEKDGKCLLNKKDLDTFMEYAGAEAKNQADKNARFACIEKETVFNWAIHYFEEDSIEGKLYNEDGTEYKAVSVKRAAPKTKPAPKQKTEGQVSLFDLYNLECGVQK